MVPSKPCQKPKERARDIESALDWMHNDVNVLEDKFLPSFEKWDMGGSIPITRRSQTERPKNLDDILSSVIDSSVAIAGDVNQRPDTIHGRDA